MEEKYFDWKGNEIKAGMIIYFVNTEHRFGRAGIIMPSGDGSAFTTLWQESDEELNERLSKPVWELGMPYEVEIIDGEYFMKCKVGEYSFSRSFKHRSIYVTGEEIIAIKGISDKNPNI